MRHQTLFSQHLFLMYYLSIQTVLTKMQEEQVGRTRRTATRVGDSVELTEVALWRKAYEFADKGEPLAQLEWIYGAAALLAGFVS
jgi:hypothetical protein